MMCKVDYYFPDTGWLKYMIVMISEDAYLVIKLTKEFYEKFEEYKEYLDYLLCTVKSKVSSDIIIFYEKIPELLQS